MTRPNKPMLAFNQNPDISKIKFPKLASPKLDGFRCYKPEDKALSRSNKPIRNNFTRDWIERNLRDGLDGELVVKGGNFNSCQSAFTTVGGEPDFEYWLFDLCTDVDEPFRHRFAKLTAYVDSRKDAEFMHRVKLVPHVIVNNVEELLEFEAWCLDHGFEGVMLRDPEGRYKCGRSTLNEELLFKLKQWEDAEGVILSLEEQMTNTNEKTTNELGHSERSSHKAGMVPADTLGKFIIRNLKTGTEHKVGTGKGMTKALRQEIWNNRDQYVGRIITYKFQPHGTKDKPRIPVWKGFRDAEDMGE